MSLEKAIKYKKEYRKPYHGSKSFDRSCRNHGSCFWCEQNRKHKYIISELKMNERMKEYIDK